MNSGKPRLRSSPRWCRRVLRRTSVWPRELWLGKHASSDPRQARRCQAFEEERETGERDQNENLSKKENKHSCSRGGAQVASARSSSRPSAPFLSTLFSESAEVCRFLRGYSQRPTTLAKGGRGEGADLVQDALTTRLIARISRKTTEPPRWLAFTAGCGEPGWRLAEVQLPSTSQTHNN